MRVAITGASGFIASAIIPHLESQGHEVLRLSRAPETSRYEISESVDCVIHLAGASIAHRWTEQYKKELYNSRIDSTKFLCESLLKLKRRPSTLLCASASGYYGNHEPNVILDEKDSSGQDFLATVCRDWEAATQSAQNAGIRVVNLRFGVVFGKSGGALAKMLPIFKLGLGGKIASGKQVMSWVALAEIPHVVDHLLKNNISGPINLVSPNAVSNEEFTKTLGKVLKRSTVLPVPAFALKLAFSEMSDALTGGARIIPRRLNESGYQFHYPDLLNTLTHLNLVG